MITTALPASRVDALSVIGISLCSILLGATPKKEKIFSLVTSIIGNVWAIASSVITFYQIAGGHAIEPHLRFFTYVLLVVTIFSSSVMLWGLASVSENGPAREDDEGRRCTVGTLGVIVALLSGLTALCLAFFSGCDDERLSHSNFCNHSPFAVVGAVVVALLVSVVLGFVVTAVTMETHKGILQSCCSSQDSASATKKEDFASANNAVDTGSQFTDAATLEEQPQQYFNTRARSTAGAVTTRCGTLVKVCLLGAYWFLVDDDLSWKTYRGHDVNWWATGQYTKHGVTIANNFFNSLPS